MKTSDIVRRAGRSLRQAKTRTLLTSLAIAVGGFTLTLALAAGAGSRQYADKIINSNVDPQMLIVVKDKSLFGDNGSGGVNLSSGLREYSENATSYGGVTLKALSSSDLKTIESNTNIEKVTPTYLVNAQYVTFGTRSDKKYTSDVTVFAASVQPEIIAGTLPENKQQIGNSEIIVPEAFLSTLGVSDAQKFIGTTVTLHLSKAPTQLSEQQLSDIIAREGMSGLERYTKPETRDISLKVRAVSKKAVTSLSASSALFISENTARDLSDYLTKGTSQYRSYVTVTALVKHGVDPAMVKDELAKHEIYAMTAKDMQGMLFTIVNLIQGIVIGFGVLALIASIFGIVNTQYISVLERTQQIGLMKALGMRARDVSRLFRYEAAWIGFLGGVIGVLLAWGIGTAMNPWITSTIGLGEGNYLLKFELLPVVILVVALVVVAILAGYFPARKAAKLDPIEALRTE